MGTETGDDDELREVYGPGQPTEPVPVVSWDDDPAPEDAPVPGAPAPSPPPAVGDGDGPRPDQRRALVALVCGLAVLAVLPGLYLVNRATETDPPQPAAQAGAVTGSSVAPTTTSTSTTLALTVDDAAVTTVTSTATASPTTVSSASTGCPTGAPGYSVDRFAWEQEAPGSDTWLLDVRGTVTNGPGATIRVESIEVAVLRGGSQVASMTIPAGRQLGPGQVLDWWQDKTPTSIPGGAPDAARVSNVVSTCIG